MTNSEADSERAGVLVRSGADGGVLLLLPNGDAVSCDAAGNELTARMNGEAAQRDAQGNEVVVRASGEVAQRDAAGGEVVVRLDGRLTYAVRTVGGGFGGEQQARRQWRRWTASCECGKPKTTSTRERLSTDCGRAAMIC